MVNICVLCGLPPGPAEDEVDVASGKATTNPADATATRLSDLLTPEQLEDCSWMNGIQGILRDGSLSPIGDTTDGIHLRVKNADGSLGFRGGGGYELNFHNYSPEADEFDFGNAIPVHPYCVPLLRRLLELEDLTLGQAFRFYRENGSESGHMEWEDQQNKRQHVYGPMIEYHHRRVRLSSPEYLWVLAPFKGVAMPVANLRRPALSTLTTAPMAANASWSGTRNPLMLLRLPDELLCSILSRLLDDPHGYESIVALQSSCKPVRARLLQPSISAFIWTACSLDFGWDILRIQSDDAGRIVKYGDGDFEAWQARVDPWVWFSTCMKSPNARNRRRIILAFNSYLSWMKRYFEEHGDFEWPGKED